MKTNLLVTHIHSASAKEGILKKHHKAPLNVVISIPPSYIASGEVGAHLYNQ